MEICENVEVSGVSGGVASPNLSRVAAGLAGGVYVMAIAV